ncbi:ATP-binding protein [Cupriavidus basilensis]|uniref:ATP-binding protein n=1 Tax=Cupriavidus basilensis TaxID=68895 RepID=UPI001E38E1E4|nr:ATP-binding protein [Cupriavidus basilensis]
METSASRTIARALVKMAPSEWLRNRATELRKCDEHGEYTAMQTPVKSWTICPRCLEVADKQGDAQRRVEIAREWAERRTQQLLGRAAIPARFEDRRLANYAPTCEQAWRALAVAKEYADNFEVKLEGGCGLILCGGVGTGKTHLAVGIAHEIMMRGLSPVFTSVMGAVRAVKETYGRDSAMTERDAIRTFIKPDLLILDEVGVQFGSDTEKLILFEIINGRYEEVKPTIVISNLAKEALAQFLGERSFDRLREGGGRLVVFDWPSYRRQA